MGCKGAENTFDRGLQKSKSGFLMELDKTDLSTRWLRSKNLVTTKPRDIRQLASECSRIMAGVYYVVTLAT